MKGGIMKNRKYLVVMSLLVAVALSLSIVSLAAYIYESRYGHNTLIQGHTGTYVRNLQTDINATGAGYCGVADGIFGLGTKHGVETYQGNRSLTVDGEAGYWTKTKLWNEMGQYQ